MFYFTSDIWHNELELWFSKPHLSLISNIWSGKTGKKFTHWKEELLLPYSKIYDPHKRKLKWATESMTEPWQMFLAHRPLNLCPYALSSAKKTTKTTTTKKNNWRAYAQNHWLLWSKIKEIRGCLRLLHNTVHGFG